MKINFFLELFEIDTQSNFVKNIAPFDRESPYFVDYFIPQIQIKLNLVCDSTEQFTVDAQNFSAFSVNILSEEIFYSKTVTYLNIIIVDQNDNSPIFTYPPANWSIGFPESKLAEKLMLKHLIQVKAYDIDEGINAKIRFTLSNSNDFVIDPESGVIYPLKACMRDKDSLELSVIATDRDGASDGNSQLTTLKIQKLREENIVVLTVENELLENVEETIKQVSVKMQLDIRPLSYFAVPSEDVTESRQLKPDTKIMINTYCFGGNGALLNSREIIDLLAAADLDNIKTFSTFNGTTSRSSDCNLTGLIVAVSVLGGLLLILSISAPLVWFFWLRKKIGGSRRTSNLSEKKLEEDSFEGSIGRSSPITAIETSYETERRAASDSEIIGIDIDGTTEGEYS